MNGFGFDTHTTKPSAAFDPLPPGWYAMRVIKAEQVDGRNPGTGQMLKVAFEIIEHAHPEHAGRQVYANFCHQHDNKQTRDIARSQIVAILHAIGKPSAVAVDDLLGGELRVKLTAQPAKDGYDAKNETRGFKALSDVEQPAMVAASAPAQAAAPTQAAAKTAAAASTARQPWKR